MSPDPASDLVSLFGLEGRTALVIGGGGVLGGAIAAGLARAGAKVAITSRTQEKIDPIAAEMGQDGLKVLGVAMDAMSAEAVKAGLDRTEAELGPIDILVNAAGGNMPEATVTPDKNFFEMPMDGFERVVGLNLFAGALLPCQLVGERMVERGKPASIINVSSMAALRPLTRVLGYSASKAAVDNVTRWLAVHFSKELKSPVRVNAIAPGFFITEQNRFLLTTDGETLTDRGRTIVEHTPMGRFGEAEELVGAALWLASQASAFVTGIVVPVDGGFSAFSGV